MALSSLITWIILARSTLSWMTTTDLLSDDTIALSIKNSSAYFQVTKSDIKALKDSNFNGLTANFTLSLSYRVSDTSVFSSINDALYESLLDAIQSELSYSFNVTDEQLTIYNTKRKNETTINDDSSHSFYTTYTTTIWTVFCAYSLDELQSFNFLLLSNESTLEDTFYDSLNITFSNIGMGSSVNHYTISIDVDSVGNIRIDTDSLYSNPSDKNVSDHNKDSNLLDIELVYIFIASAVSLIAVATCIGIVIYRRKKSPIRYKLSVLEKSLNTHGNVHYVGGGMRYNGHNGYNAGHQTQNMYTPPHLNTVPIPKSPVMSMKPRKSIKLEMQLSREEYRINGQNGQSKSPQKQTKTGNGRSKSKSSTPNVVSPSSYNELMVRRDSLSEVAHRTDSNLHVHSFEEHDEYMGYSDDEELRYR